MIETVVFITIESRDCYWKLLTHYEMYCKFIWEDVLYAQISMYKSIVPSLRQKATP